MLGHIAEVTDRPVRYAINTRSQPRRVLRNAVMRAASIEVVAGAPAAARIPGQGTAMAAGAEGMLGIDAGGIQPQGARDRLIVHLAEDQLVFAGDVLCGGGLLAGLPVSHTDGWIDAGARRAARSALHG